MSAFSFRAARLVSLAAIALLGACQDSLTGVPAAASADVAAAAAPAAAARAGATLAWNAHARALVVKYATSAPASIRMFALLSVAQYNALVMAEKARVRSTSDTTPRQNHASDEGAVAAASAAVLAFAYPQEEAALQALVQAQADAPAERSDRRESFVAGQLAGLIAASPLIERARTDGYFDTFTGTVPVCDSCWKATSPPAFATLGKAKAYFLASNDQFRPAPPPAFSSPAFAAALAEVRQIADTRTAQQDSIAKFWALPAGTVGAQGYWNVRFAELAARYNLDDRRAARGLALLNVAAYDAIVASHEAKYHYWLLRPKHADAGIALAIGMPSFPSYPSNHATLAGAAATVLSAVFPAERARLAEEAAEGAISRVYGGIHYRFDTDAGLVLGQRVAAWTLAHDVRGHARFDVP